MTIHFCKKVLSHNKTFNCPYSLHALFYLPTLHFHPCSFCTKEHSFCLSRVLIHRAGKDSLSVIQEKFKRKTVEQKSKFCHVSSPSYLHLSSVRNGKRPRRVGTIHDKYAAVLIIRHSDIPLFRDSKKQGKAAIGLLFFPNPKANIHCRKSEIP